MNEIEIYDDFLSSAHAQIVYNTAQDSFFKIGWHDTEEPQHRAFPNLHSMYSFEDVQKLKILNPILEILKDKNITIDNYKNCIVNLTKPLDVNFIHAHPYEEIGVLYYCNPTWNAEWGGETLFYEDNKKDIRFSSPYTPNRLIIFDGNIPHTIKPQNLLGSSYRFSVSLFFYKEKI
jgi:SM-20-related protein